MAIDLTERICIVTGAGQGIGAAVATGFARRGAKVIATDLKPPTGEQYAMTAAWDVADPEAGQRVVAQVLERFGRVDALVANAGVYPQQHWQDVSDDDWRKVLAVNLDGCWHACRAAAEPMARQGYGKIVTVSSIEYHLGVAAHVHYDAAKAGVIGLTRSLSRAVGPQGVRVNCVMPGAVRTEGELQQGRDQQAIADLVAERQALPHRLEPEAIEPTFAFLCSEESDAITGQVVCVDHGWVHH